MKGNILYVAFKKDYEYPPRLFKTFSKEKVENAFLKSKNGEIVIIHMNHPESQTAEGTIKAIKELKQKGFRFVKLADYKLK